MELSTLMHWRRIVPGAMFAVVIAPVFLPLVDAVVESQLGSGSADYLKAISIAIFLVLGHVYDASPARWNLDTSTRETTKDIEARLRATLRAAGAADLEIEIWDSAKKRWMRLLFRIVDADPTLSALSKRIYDAGFNWSSFIDGAVILLYGGLLGIIGAVIFGAPSLIAYYTIVFFVGLFAHISVAAQARKHRKLCMEQQDHIQYFCSARLLEEFRNALHA